MTHADNPRAHGSLKLHGPKGFGLIPGGYAAGGKQFVVFGAQGISREEGFGGGGVKGDMTRGMAWGGYDPQPLEDGQIHTWGKNAIDFAGIKLEKTFDHGRQKFTYPFKLRFAGGNSGFDGFSFDGAGVDLCPAGSLECSQTPYVIAVGVGQKNMLQLLDRTPDFCDVIEDFLFVGGSSCVDKGQTVRLSDQIAIDDPTRDEINVGNYFHTSNYIVTFKFVGKAKGCRII